MPKELALETAAGRKISNSQPEEISSFERGQLRRLDDQYGTAVKRRAEPSPRYNCHGLTFASRRTGVFESAVVFQILEEDQYQEIPPEGVLPGDVILYFDDRNDVEHSGIVVSPPLEDPLHVPTVYSKWGKYAELIHKANRCPYSFARCRYFRIGK